jgi:hypothetical protein
MKHLIIVFLFLCVYNFTSAQTNFFPQKNYVIEPITFNTLSNIDIYQPSLLTNSIIYLNNAFNISTYNYDDLAIFCKLEVKMEKASGIPIKFRLGEVNYVEKLEGKPYSIFY